MTKIKQPTEKEWKRLYEIAVKVKELAPWEWMYEDNIFGVQNPETEEIGFVSVMGVGGEHYGISLYLGAEGLFGYDNLQDQAINDPSALEDNAFALFDIPQLQASFENRGQLEKDDHAVIKKLGLKFRGSFNYPMFRSIVPGFLPYYITSDEARFLSYVLEQLLEVAPRVQADEEILDDTDIDEEFESYLVRVPKKQNGTTVWHDEHLVIKPPPDKDISVSVPEDVMEEIKHFPQNKNLTLEVDIFYAPQPVAEKGKRPFIPKILMFADSRSGMVLGVELLKSYETEVENFTQLVTNIFESLRKLNARPKVIKVSSEELFQLFRSFTQQLTIELKQVEELKAVEAAKEGMFGFFDDSMF